MPKGSDNPPQQAENTPQAIRLTLAEKKQLQSLLAQQDETISKRAHIVLLAAERLSSAEIGKRVGLSASRVRFWVRRYRTEGMALFLKTPLMVEDIPQSVCENESALTQLCNFYGVDVLHARHVAECALVLFDALPGVHKLPHQRRRILEAAALLHNIGYTSDPDNHHITGCKILLGHELAGYSEEERDVVACTVLFHRKKVKPEKEAIFQSLSNELQREVLALSAILRVADAMDYSQSQSTHIVSASCSGNQLCVVHMVIKGPQSRYEVPRIVRKADLWQMVFGVPLDVEAVAHPDCVEEVTTERGIVRVKPCKRNLEITSETRMGELGLKVFEYYFEQMVKCEKDARKGNPEAIHAMRVAAGRLRVAAKLFKEHFPGKYMRRIARGLRRTAGMLGNVRDLDLLMQDLEQSAKQGLVTQSEIMPLRDYWKIKRFDERANLALHLDSEDYVGLNRWLGQLLQYEVLQVEAQPDRLCEVMPAIIWDKFQNIRAYEHVVQSANEDELNQLRVKCKRLRYVLELVSELTGEPGSQAVNAVTKVQDRLGMLNDLTFAVTHLQTLLENAEEDLENVDNNLVVSSKKYLTVCKQQYEQLKQSLLPLWEGLIGLGFRKMLGEAVARI